VQVAGPNRKYPLLFACGGTWIAICGATIVAFFANFWRQYSIAAITVFVDLSVAIVLNAIFDIATIRHCR